MVSLSPLPQDVQAIALTPAANSRKIPFTRPLSYQHLLITFVLKNAVLQVVNKTSL